MSNQATIADRCVLNRDTEVASEFITGCYGPPARIFDHCAYGPEKLSSVIQKEFCTLSDMNRLMHRSNYLLYSIT
jgi:hypothetical protein